MASTDTEAPPALPDYVTDPDAVLKDKDIEWRYGKAPDYSKTRQVFAETKTMTHAPLSLPHLVENLVKNWEIEASFKPTLSHWRTIDPSSYSFAINGSAPQDASYMLKHGTYNAIVAPNEYYSPEYSDFASSHKTFKRMMPTFAWEVLEVYSGPPVVAFRWRHWGAMEKDYVGFNNKGEKVTAPAHHGAIDIQGVTVATVNAALQLQSIRTWFDPMDMFRQLAPAGIAKREAVDTTLAPGDALDSTVTTDIEGTARAVGGIGCPFRGNEGREAVAPFEPHLEVGGGGDKIEFPNQKLSEEVMGVLREGGQEDAERDPYVRGPGEGEEGG